MPFKMTESSWIWTRFDAAPTFIHGKMLLALVTCKTGAILATFGMMLMLATELILSLLRPKDAAIPAALTEPKQA